jgi:hypothetical protein
VPVPLWVPLAELGIAMLAVAVAVFVLRVGRGRAVNQNLAIVLGLEALAATGVAFIRFARGEQPEYLSPFFGVFLAGLGALPWFYLRFLSVLDTPLTAWLRRPRVRSLLVIIGGLNLVLWAGFFVGKITPIPLQPIPWWPLLLYFTVMILAVLAVAVFALVASISAWRRTASGTLERARARAFVAAFGIRDGAYAILGAVGFLTLYGLGPRIPADALLLATLLYLPLLVYGVLKTQLFDMEVHLRRGVRAAFMSAVFLVALVVVLELLQDVVGSLLGWAVGVASAVVLTFGVKPMERAATRLAYKLVNPPDPAELEERKRGVYRVAFREVWQDGRIEPHERERLTTLGAQLGLSPREMADIEDAVAAERPLARTGDVAQHESGHAVR